MPRSFVPCSSNFDLVTPNAGLVLFVAGIKKPKRNRYRSTKGVDPKFLRNKRYALRGTKKALAEARAAEATA